VADYEDTWLLLPELCIYEEGKPPAAGEYRVAVRAGQVSISMRWTDAGGEEHALAFGGPCDGRPHPSAQPGVASVSFTQHDASTLDSTAFGPDGEALMHARRRRSADGELLCTVQRMRRADGSWYSNVQIYRHA
jgi:hypothetical protein